MQHGNSLIKQLLFLGEETQRVPCFFTFTMVSIFSTLNATSRTPSPCRERWSDISLLSGSYGDSNTNTICDYTILMIKVALCISKDQRKIKISKRTLLFIIKQAIKGKSIKDYFLTFCNFDLSYYYYICSYIRACV